MFTDPRYRFIEKIVRLVAKRLKSMKALIFMCVFLRGGEGSVNSLCGNVLIRITLAWGKLMALIGSVMWEKELWPCGQIEAQSWLQH